MADLRLREVFTGCLTVDADDYARWLRERDADFFAPSPLFPEQVAAYQAEQVAQWLCEVRKTMDHVGG